MITTDIRSLFLDVKREQLITEKSKMPAGSGIIVNGEVKHVVFTDFLPISNIDLIRKAEEFYSITWKYAHSDASNSNFAFCGVIDDIIFTDDRNQLIQLGVEVINSYNQRSGADIFYCFYNHTKDCWIKTNISILNDNIDEQQIQQQLNSLKDIQFGITDIPKDIPNKFKQKIVSNMNGHHDAYDFITALSKVSTDYWEHSSYELSRKTVTNLFKKLVGG